MIENDDPEIEHSPLCRRVEKDGTWVEVNIFRLAEGDDGWSLEVVDEENASTVWTQTFATDIDAYAEFCRALDVEGIRSFIERPEGRPN